MTNLVFQRFQVGEAKVGAVEGGRKDPTEKGRGTEAIGRREPRVEDGTQGIEWWALSSGVICTGTTVIHKKTTLYRLAKILFLGCVTRPLRPRKT